MHARLHHRRPRWTWASGVTVVVVLAAVAAGCGDDDGSSDSTPTSVASTVAETTVDTSTSAAGSLVAQANALCATYNEAVQANGPFPLEDFDPANPSPDDLPIVAAHFAPVLDAGDQLIEQLGALEGGSAEERARFDEYLAALEAENANARAQADAGAQRDVAGFTATLETTDTLGAARIAAATKLGATSCAAP